MELSIIHLNKSSQLCILIYINIMNPIFNLCVKTVKENYTNEN